MQRFHFDRDFDAELEEEQGAETALLTTSAYPALSPAEIAAIRAEAFAAGKAEGMAEATAATEARLMQSFEAEQSATLAAIVPQIESLRTSRAAHHQLLEQDLSALIHALAEQILPEIYSQFAPKRIEAFCRHALRMAEGKGGLELRLAPEMAASLAEVLPQTSVSGAPMRIISDAELAPGEARAHWDQGNASYSLNQLYQSLISSLAEIAQAAQNPAHPDRS